MDIECVSLAARKSRLLHQYITVTKSSVSSVNSTTFNAESIKAAIREELRGR